MNEKRLADILTYMRGRQNATVTELCKFFSVSDMTIRRDLIELEKRNQVIRFHGGASVFKENSAASMQVRLDKDYVEKTEIGSLAVEYLRILMKEEKPRVVFFGSGSTMFRMAELMPSIRNVTMLTDNVPIASELSKHEDNTVIMVGGQLLLPSQNVVGYTAEQMIRSFAIDYAFISTSAIDEEGNIYMFNMLETSAFQAIIQTAKHIVLLADHTKFGMVNTIHLCKIDSRFTVITDSHTPEEVISRLRKMKVSIISA